MAASIRKTFSLLSSGSFRLLRTHSERQFHLAAVRTMPAHDAAFEQAKERLKTLSEDPGNQVKLKMYGLFKQATVGKCNAPKPGMMDLVGKAKWQSWNELGSMSQDDAQKAYINVVESLVAEEQGSSSAEASGDGGKYKQIKVTREGKVFKILLNRPTKKNAINYEMYREWIDALNEASQDKSVSIAVVTGAGDYYCSGNDLANFANIKPSDIGKMALDAREILREFVGTFIDFPKPLIGLINGPAVGVSVTTLGLFDAVYASDRATFHTPFTVLGQSPEGCSSYVFPKLMGSAKANEVLLFNKKLTAQEAKERNLITNIIPENSFQKESDAMMQGYSKLPPKSMTTSKNLIREVEKKKLHEVNEKECDLLVERWQSDECMNAIMAFFTRKSNL
ncbi:enoyl-CoA delta isomerase 2-like isoform X1 [Haliotis rufescens]|uniref:enoyl-CoA delta isomerase 2-like isoform X1 n=2 Tax=Haliotis rufescens TaxID=6454 RepID=UPI001EAF9699|nr:enoyl-CoA delta isomerase 2-like isoform X1 [Haliotis rufescens]